MSKLIKQSIKKVSAAEEHWLVFDGPTDSQWMENLNQILGENEVFCMPNGERIKLLKDLKLIYEVDLIASISPSIIARCNVLYIPIEKQ